MRRFIASLGFVSTVACGVSLTAPEDAVPGAPDASPDGPRAETDANVDAAMDAGAGEQFDDVTHLVANDTHVFVAFRDGLARCTTTSCERKTLPPAVELDARAIAIDANGTLFLTFQGALYQCGGKPFDCAPERSNIAALRDNPAAELVVMSSTFAWTSARSTKLFHVQRLVDGAFTPTELARVGAPLAQNLDGATYGNKNGIFRADNSGPHDTFAASFPNATGLASVPTKLAAVPSDRSGVTFFGAGGSGTGIASIGSGGVTALAITPTAAYWTRTIGDIVRCTHGVTPLSTTTYKAGLATPRLIAANASAVWFTTGANADGRGRSTLNAGPP